jgi:hypothetical protein
MNHATVVDVIADMATARSTMESTYWLPDGARMRLYARYEDDLRREPDREWRFARRHWHTVAMLEAGTG